MNDRFKFRLPFYNNKGEFSHFEFISIGESLPAYNAGVMHHNNEYEQCTGLKDKNGNLIYEGDLLGGLPVVWVNELNGFRVKINTIHGWDWHYINEFTNQEVTGNIHEQAEQKDVK